MKKLISMLVVLAMLLAIAPAVIAVDDDFGVETYHELVMGENEAVYTAETDTAQAQPAYFTWTADEAGTLTIDFSDEDEGSVWCNVMQIRDGELVFDENYEGHGIAVTVNVEAGDKVDLQIEELNWQDAVLHFTATFEGAVVMNGSGTMADPWIIESVPTELKGTISVANAANQEWEGYYYQFTATEAGTIDWSSWSGCGVLVKLKGKVVDGDSVAIKVGDELLVNIWNNEGAGNYVVTLAFEASSVEEGGNEGGEEGGEDVEGLVLGDNTFDVPESGNDGDVFVATENGILVITVTEMMIFDAESGDYIDVSPSMHFGRMGNYVLVVNEEETTSYVYTLEVVAGQEVSVYIATGFGAAALATVNLSMEAEEEGGEENDTPASGTVDLTAEDAIIYEITPEVDGTLTVTISSTVGWEVHIGDASGDMDARYQSDWATSPVSETLLAGVTYTITIHAYDNDSWDYIAGTITYDIVFSGNGEGGNEGGNEGGEEVPECEHWNTDFEYDEENNLLEICQDCGAVVATYEYGSFYNPILVDFMWNEDGTAASAVVTVPAGQSLWFGQYRIGGMNLTINGEDFGKLEDRGWYDPAVFCITNDGAEDATYELVLSHILGSYNNPIVLEELGQFEIVLGAYSDGMHYRWVATADGTLTLTIEGNNWTYVINNETSGDYGEKMFAVYGEPNTYSVKVKAGDVLIIGFGTLDENFEQPAETLTVTLELTASEEEEEDHTLELGDNEVSDGKLEFVATEDGTLYFRVTTLAYKWGDVTDEIRDYMPGDVELYINGVLVAEGYFGFIEVAAGDVVTFEWVSAGYYTFNGVLSLSYENNNPVLGTQERPVELKYEDCPADTIVIAPGAVVWYELDYAFYDAVLTIKGENVFVQYSYYSYDIWDYVTETVYAENGEIVLSPIPTMNIAIGNAGTEDATFVIEAYIPEGTSGNPADLVLGENVAEVEQERPDFFYFDWTAPTDGVLTITVTGENWMFYIVNPETYEQSDTFFFYMDPMVNTVEWTVTAGDTIIVAVSTTLDWNNIDWSDPDATKLPAGTIYVDAAFACNEHGDTYIDADYCYEDEMMFDLVERCIYCDAEFARYLPGTEENPVLVDFQWNDTWTAASATVTVPAGQTMYFGQYRIGGMILTINGVEYGILEGMWGMPCIFTITNEGTEDATYELVLTYPVGTEGNPDELPVGEVDELVLPEGNNGYCYEWVVEADGTLTFNVDGTDWLFFVENYGSDLEDWSDDFSSEIHYFMDGDAAFISIEVKAGDHIFFRVSTLDENWNYPAATLKVWVEFAAENDVPPTGDTSIIMAVATALVSAMSIVALPKKKEN